MCGRPDNSGRRNRSRHAKTASAAPLEQLAEAMTAQTIAFFAPPAGHAPTGSAPAVRLAHK
jgi:hypothetical protein